MALADGAKMRDEKRARPKSSNRWNFFFLIFQSLELLLVAPGAFAISTPDRIQFADGLYARGLYDLALKEYLPLLAAQPAVTNLDAVLFRSAECYRYLQDKKNAGLTYEQLLQRFPQSPFAWRAEFRRAEMSATGGEYLDAIGRFRALTEKNPPAEIAASAYYYLGYSQDRMNMKEEAAKAFKTVVHEYPNSPFFSYACIGLADIEQRLGASAEELRGLYEKAARAPATPRVGAEAWFQLGESYYRDGDFSNAAHAYEQLLTRYPSDPRGDEARLPAAWSFHNIERFADALKIADSALKKVGPNEREADWKYLQANALRQLQRVDEARAIYERLLADNKDASIASASAYELALMSFEKKDYAAVAQLENFARGTNAYLKDFYWMLAESETALSNQAAAAQFYGKIAGEFPSSDRAAPALFKSAQLAQAAKQWKEAASLYHQAQKAGSKGDLAADALLASAYCLGEAGDREAALQDLAALSAAYPNFAGMDRALYRKAQLEVELDRADQARATLEQLLKKYPQSETAASGHYLLGVLLEKAKEFGAADQNYRVAEQGKLKAPLADQVRLRRVAVLQRLDKDEEAAELLQTHLKRPLPRRFRLRCSTGLRVSTWAGNAMRMPMPRRLSSRSSRRIPHGNKSRGTRRGAGARRSEMPQARARLISRPSPWMRRREKASRPPCTLARWVSTRPTLMRRPTTIRRPRKWRRRMTCWTFARAAISASAKRRERAASGRKRRDII